MGEREIYLEDLISRYLDIQDHSCIGCEDDSCGAGSAHQELIEDMRKALGKDSENR